MRRQKSGHRRYYADECIPLPSVSHLRSKGFSIIHANDKGYINVPDLEQLKISKKLNRVLVALDRDFWQKKEFDLSGHPGIIVLKTSSSIPPAVNRVAEKVLGRVGRIKLKEAILYASITKIRRYRKGKQDIISWEK